jgi:phytoene dehydrogenase-like protein
MMSSTCDRYDLAIVGAGHNGLVCAFYLAQAGLRVAVFEAKETVGGACKTEELIDGYQFSTCANWVGWWRPKIIQDMRLMDRGLQIGGADVWSRVLPDGRGFTWWPEEDALVQEIARFSKADAERWREWRSLWDDVCGQLGPWLLSLPPSWEDIAKAAGDDGDRVATLRGRSAAEVIDAHFTSEVMRSGIVAPHDVGSLYEPGSAVLMALAEAMRHFSETGKPAPSGYVRGGMGKITEAMRAAAAEAGAVVFTAAPVDHVLVADGRTAGVALAGGEIVAAERVVLGCDIGSTIRLLGDALDDGLRGRLASLRTIVAPLKLHCALSGLPEWRAFPGSDLPYRGPLNLCRSRDQSEDAWRAATQGELPRDPFMNVMTPSFWDESIAPAGCHTLSVWSLYAPVRPSVGTWESRREEMLELMLASIEREAPDFRDHLVDAVLLTPADLETRVGLSRGNIHHIDLSPEQIFAQRPLPELANYRFPIDGLYGCGSAHHPYGEVSGAPGHNAAHAILEDMGMVDASWQQAATP